MKKRIIMGAPIGVFISVLVAICISYSIGDGNFYFVSPTLANRCGNEINAVFVQFIGCIIYGAVFGGSTVIWELENWSITKQTAVHFAITVSSTLLSVTVMGWANTNPVSYMAVFIVIYIIIWLTQYISMKSSVNKFNNKLNENNNK